MRWSVLRKSGLAAIGWVAAALWRPRVRLVRLGLSICVAVPATQAMAAPPPPPRPEAARQFARASCGGVRRPKPPPEVAVTVRPVAASALGATDGRVGRLQWKWGVHVASSDPRLGAVTGLEFDETFGLIATTAGRDWLTFDIRDFRLDKITSVGIAPMLGAPEAASALVSSPTFGGKETLYASFPGHHSVVGYAVAVCGMAARPVPLLNTEDSPPVTAMADVFYSHLGLAGHGVGGLKTGSWTPDELETVSLKKEDLPALPGYRLKALANPLRIVPYVIALWAPASGRGEAIMQQIYVGRWGDVWDDTPFVIELARLPITPAAIYAVSGQEEGPVTLFLAMNTAEAGSVDIHMLEFTPVWPPQPPAAKP